MKSVGEAVKAARAKKHYSLEKLEEKTKIKKGFIDAIEKENWEKLPEYPVVVGFVKRIAETLNADTKQFVAILRRDYPPKVLRVNPKPDISDKFIWSPKMTFLAGITLVVLITLSYLGLQYRRFINPPKLEITIPKNEQVITENLVKIVGSTDTDAVIKVNNQPVIVNDNGEFSAEVEVTNDTHEITIVATSRSGKETQKTRTINPQLE